MGATAAQQGSSQLRDILTVLRTRKWSIALITVLAVAASIWFSSQEVPIYKATARLLVKPETPLNGAPPATVNLQTESQIVRSLPVAQRVARHLGIDDPRTLLGNLTVSPIASGFATSDVLEVSYTSTSPDLAATVVNSFARKYANYRRHQSLKVLVAAQKSIGDRLETVQSQMAEVNRKLTAAQKAGNDTLAATLDVQRNAILARLGVLQQRLQDVQPDRTALLAGAQLIAPATVPTAPTSPNYKVNFAVGLLLGLILGLAYAAVRDRLDDRFRGRAEIEAALGVPVLATIPQFRVGRERWRRERSKKSRAGSLMLLTQSHGPASEAYRSLRTSVQFAASSQGLRTLLVTSPSEGEGKSLTTANLAVALAQARRRVLVVSGDMRRPTIERYFELERSARGLSTCLLEPEFDAGSLVVPTRIDNLELLPCGRIPHNPAELLTTPYLKSLMRDLSSDRDLLLIDSPPVLPVSDTHTMSSAVDGVLLVLDASRTKRSAAAEAVREIAQLGGKVVGIVINRVEQASPYYDRANYYTAYASDSEPVGEDASVGRRRSITSAGD